MRKRCNRPTVWIAVVALLINAVLPGAVAAAMAREGLPPLALCGAGGGKAPQQPLPGLPPRHCALCAGPSLALLPSRPDGPVVRLAEIAPAAVAPRAVRRLGRPDHPTAQPRAPPPAV